MKKDFLLYVLAQCIFQAPLFILFSVWNNIPALWQINLEKAPALVVVMMICFCLYHLLVLINFYRKLEIMHVLLWAKMLLFFFLVGLSVLLCKEEDRMTVAMAMLSSYLLGQIADIYRTRKVMKSLE